MKIKFNVINIQAVYFDDLEQGDAFTYLPGPDTDTSLFMKINRRDSVDLNTGTLIQFNIHVKVYPHAQAVVEAGPVTMEKKW